MGDMADGAGLGMPCFCIHFRIDVQGHSDDVSAQYKYEWYGK